MSERRSPPLPIPKVAPEDWGHDLAIFRESFLCYLTDPEHNEAFRAFGKAQFEILFEAACYGSTHSNLDDTAYRLQAALADLRHLQGFLAFTAECSGENSDTARDQYDGDEEAKKHNALCRLGNRLSKKLGAVADELEQAVGDWHFEE